LAQLQRLREQTISARVQWELQLKELLAFASPMSKVALVGVGHPLRGDDYVGSFIVKILMNECRAENIGFFDAQDGVEMVVSRIAKFSPKHILFIDACEMNARPGHIALISVADTNYPFFTTHGIPLKLLASQFLSDSEARVLAIQPEHMEVGDHLSPRINDRALYISGLIATTLKEAGHANGN
jgi:hydrogenase 3 maturation protease